MAPEDVNDDADRLRADPDWMRPLGATGITVSAITLGASPLGGMPALYGRDVPAAQAADLLRAVLHSSIRTIDTSNGYSGGESERRIGAAIADAGGLAPDMTVITKVDPKDGDYSGARVRDSVRESCARLGIERLPLVHLHDPENFAFEHITARGGALDALVALRESGEVGAIGLAGGPVPEMQRYLATGVFDAVLAHNRWTLVDRSAGVLFAAARDAGVAVVNAAVYGSGILADPTNPQYAYRPANEGVRAAVAAMLEVCERHGTDIATAALQFSLREVALQKGTIATTVVGMSRPERVAATLAAAAAPLPDELFDELGQLVPAPQWWLEPPR